MFFLKNIFFGYFNWLKLNLRILSQEQITLYNKRLNICLKCKYNQKNICSYCGCFIKAKTKVDYKLDKNNKSISGCPKKYW